MPTPNTRMLPVSMLLLAGWCQAQHWLPVLPPARFGHAMAYDLLRGRTVLFGGYEQLAPTGVTMLFDGTRWTAVQSSNGPAARSNHAMAFDWMRGRTVMFGGESGSVRFGDTWEFDGVQWTQVSAAGPSIRSGHAMAFDAIRGRTVLFGGQGSSSQLSDTWEFDGITWVQVAPAVSPPPRHGHAMAFHTGTGRTVLFGGSDNGALGDTWQFDGVTWTQVNSPITPSPRFQAAMAYDVSRSRVVLHGGAVSNSGSPTLSDTWEFDGLLWIPSPAASGVPRTGHAMAYDIGRARTVCFAGSYWTWTGHVARADTAEFHGGRWSSAVAVDSPLPRIGHTMVHDPIRDRTVLFGGALPVGFSYLLHGDTWEFGDGRWKPIETNGRGPRPREGHVMSFDSRRGRVVLFGGYANRGWTDTWEYDGRRWSEIVTSSSPSPRNGAGMAFDPVRGRMVLFGGQGAGLLADTWEFDGQQWLQATTTTSPSARVGHLMAFDARRGSTVLFGGLDALGSQNDTWEFNGTNWTPVPTTNPPPLYVGQALVDDPVRGRLLLFVAGTDVWQLEGTAWSRTILSTGPSPRRDQAVAFSWSTGRVLLFGGGFLPFPRDDTWEFVPPDVPTFARYGTGCAGSAGVPQLDRVGTSVPALGTTFSVTVSALPPASAFAVLGGGTDMAQWRGSPLPLPLSPYGLPGCQLWISPDVTMLIPANNGVASRAFAIPATPSLAGSRLGLQALSFDPATASGIGAVSNGAILRLH